MRLTMIEMGMTHKPTSTATVILPMVLGHEIGGRLGNSRENDVAHGETTVGDPLLFLRGN